MIFLGPPGVGKTHLGDQPRHCRGSERAQSLLRRSGRPHHLARRSQDRRSARTPPQDPHLSLAPGHRRDRLPAGQPDRRHALLPTHQPALRARIHRAHVQQRVLRVGSDLGRRSHGRCTHRSLATPLSYRQHTWQQLPHAQAHRPFQDPPLASCAAEPFTPQEKESKSKGKVDELEARHLRQVCNFRWPDLCSFRWPLTIASLRLVVVPCLNAHKRSVRDPLYFFNSLQVQCWRPLGVILGPLPWRFNFRPGCTDS